MTTLDDFLQNYVHADIDALHGGIWGALVFFLRDYPDAQDALKADLRAALASLPTEQEVRDYLARIDSGLDPWQVNGEVRPWLVALLGQLEDGDLSPATVERLDAEIDERARRIDRALYLALRRHAMGVEGAARPPLARFLVDYVGSGERGVGSALAAFVADHPGSETALGAELRAALDVLRTEHAVRDYLGGIRSPLDPRRVDDDCRAWLVAALDHLERGRLDPALLEDE